MNVLFRSQDYDYHTLLKVAEMAGLAGIIGFHPAGDDYLLTFPDDENTEQTVPTTKRACAGWKTTSGTFKAPPGPAQNSI